MNRLRLARLLLALPALLALGACVGPQPGGSLARMERPVSEMPVASEGRRKAKVHVELGQAYFQVARYGVALDEAKAAISYDAGYAPAYQLMGLVHMFLEENQIADANFAHALSLAPGDPEIQNSYGWFLCSNGKEAAGIEMLQAAARNPYYQTPTRAHANAGLCQLPPEFIAADGFGVTEAFRRWCRPLISGEDLPAFRDGLPDYLRLQLPLLPPALPAYGG